MFFFNNFTFIHFFLPMKFFQLILLRKQLKLGTFLLIKQNQPQMVCQKREL